MGNWFPSYFASRAIEKGEDNGGGASLPYFLFIFFFVLFFFRVKSAVNYCVINRPEVFSADCWVGANDRRELTILSLFLYFLLAFGGEQRACANGKCSWIQRRHRHRKARAPTASYNTAKSFRLDDPPEAIIH